MLRHHYLRKIRFLNFKSLCKILLNVEVDDGARLAYWGQLIPVIYGKFLLLVKSN